jgi:ATP-dependent DNA helicase RecQ
MMRQYAELTGCRRTFLLNYLGETRTEPCGSCDICESGSAEGNEADSSAFPPNSQVMHASLGPGTVMHVKDDTMVVLFEQAGYRTLSIDVVTEQGLLQLVSGNDGQA